MYGSFFITYFVDLMIFIFKIFEDDSLGAEKRGTLAHVSNSVSKSFKLYLLFTKECLSFFFLCFFLPVCIFIQNGMVVFGDPFNFGFTMKCLSAYCSC